ncbi:CXADR-like membrane protein isoform X2 [Petromyzon marinus]|uniref:CXADR-like membrane protein isoform X2 n=1 Tax=Petromyzon marinus TaxID=7757 RepID=UPI003F6F8FB7
MAWPATLAVTVLLVSSVWARDAHFSKSATLGSNVTLPCHFEPREGNDVIRVQWKRNDSFKILYYSKNDQNNCERVTWRGDLSTGNASIEIIHLQPKDVGNYTCDVFCNSDGTWNKTIVQLVVLERKDYTHGNQDRNVAISVCVVSVLVIAAAGLAIRAKRRSNLASAGGGDVVHPALMRQHPGGHPASVVNIHLFSGGGGGVGGEN